MERASGQPTSQQAADRLSAQSTRMRWVALHCAGRALLRRLDVDDLVQEAMLRAWQDREHWPAPESGEQGLGRWLAVVVRHATIDAARACRARKRSGREQRLELSDFSQSALGARDLPAQTAGPSTRAGVQETRAQLEQAFQRLSGEHRRVLSLRQFEGLSAALSAQRMGKSEVAVHSLFRRALQAWERELGGDFSTLGDEFDGNARSNLP